MVLLHFPRRCIGFSILVNVFLALFIDPSVVLVDVRCFERFWTWCCCCFCFCSCFSSCPCCTCTLCCFYVWIEFLIVFRTILTWCCFCLWLFWSSFENVICYCCCCCCCCCCRRCCCWLSSEGGPGKKNEWGARGDGGCVPCKLTPRCCCSRLLGSIVNLGGRKKTH